MVKYQYFLWTNDWRSENIVFILNQEWHIDIIPWHPEGLKTGLDGLRGQILEVLQSPI